MSSLLLGITGFVLYLLYDINSFTVQNRILALGFGVGSLLIGAATVLELWAAWHTGAFDGAGDVILLVLALTAFAALIHCLFFALPFDETYISPECGRKVCADGVYALCRHPVALCFFAMYLFAGLAALPSTLLRTGMIFSVLNTAYVLFQDRVTFPRSFCNYTEYRTQVPFIIPTKNSIRTAAHTGRLGRKEETL